MLAKLIYLSFFTLVTLGFFSCSAKLQPSNTTTVKNRSNKTDTAESSIYKALEHSVEEKLAPVYKDSLQTIN